MTSISTDFPSFSIVIIFSDLSAIHKALFNDKRRAAASGGSGRTQFNVTVSTKKRHYY